MFIIALCVLFLIKLRWPKNKSLYSAQHFISIMLSIESFLRHKISLHIFVVNAKTWGAMSRAYKGHERCHLDPRFKPSVFACDASRQP